MKNDGIFISIKRGLALLQKKPRGFCNASKKGYMEKPPLRWVARKK